MTLKEQLNQDLKVAMLGGDKTLAETLRGIKSAILYAEVAANKRDTGLEDSELISLLQKEAKKRQESADLFGQGGNHEKQQAELAEKAVIEKYLPAQLSDDELNAVIDSVIARMGDVSPQAMGQVIGQVKAKTGGSVDGARIAAAVKAKLT